MSDHPQLPESEQLLLDAAFLDRLTTLMARYGPVFAEAADGLAEVEAAFAASFQPGAKLTIKELVFGHSLKLAEGALRSLLIATGEALP